MVLRDFSGGINTRAMPQNMTQNESVLNTNMVVINGGLTPIDISPSTINTPLGANIFNSAAIHTETVLTNNFIGTDPYQVNDILGNCKIGIYNTQQYIQYMYARSSLVKSDLYSLYTINSVDTVRHLNTSVETSITDSFIRPVLIPKYTTADTITANYLNTKLVSPVLTVNPIDATRTPLTTYRYYYSIYDPVMDIESNLQFIGTIDRRPTDTMTVTYTLNKYYTRADMLIYFYRIGGNLTDFHKIGQASIGTTTNTDTIDDLTALNNPVYDGGFNIPYTLKYATEYKGAIFGYSVEVTSKPSINHFLVFSEVGKFHFFKPTSYIRFDEKITGIGTCIGGLLVFTRNTTTLISGDNAANYTKVVISNTIGCVDSGSIVYQNGYCIWSNWESLYGTQDGFNLKNLSYTKLASIRGLFETNILVPTNNPIHTYTITGTDAIMYMDSYYFKGLYINRTGSALNQVAMTSAEVTPSKIMKYNMLTGVFTMLDIASNISQLATLSIGSLYNNPYFYLQDEPSLFSLNNALYATVFNKGKVYKITEEPSITLSNSNTLATIDWVSPRYSETKDTIEKVYKDLLINIAGKARVTVTTNIGSWDYDISSPDIETFIVIPIRLPQEAKRSYWYQLHIKGICRISEIKYDVAQAGDQP